MVINQLKSLIIVVVMQIMVKNLHVRIIYSCYIMLLHDDIDLLKPFSSTMIFRYHIFQLMKLIIKDYLICLPLLLNCFQQKLLSADNDIEEYRFMIQEGLPNPRNHHDAFSNPRYRSKQQRVIIFVTHCDLFWSIFSLQILPSYHKQILINKQQLNDKLQRMVQFYFENHSDAM